MGKQKGCIKISKHMNLKNGTFSILLLILITISLNSVSIHCQDLPNDNDFSLSDFYKKQYFITDTNVSDTVVLNDYQLILNTIDSSEYFSTLDNYYQFLDYPKIEMCVPKDKDYELSAIARDNLINFEDSIFKISIVDSLITIPKYIYGSADGIGYIAEIKYFGYVSDIGWFVFWEEGFEGGGFFAIDKENGERIRIPGFPKYSPNRELILSAFYDLDIGFFAHVLQVFEFNGYLTDKLILQYSPNWGFEGAIWKDNTTIYFIRITYNSHKMPDVERFCMSMEFKKLASH